MSLKIAKQSRINGKHIKHSANTKLVSVIERETTFLVKSKTPFISAVKQIQRSLDKFNKKINKKSTNKYQGGDYKKVKYIVVKGMGKAMEKTLSLGVHFEENYKVDVFTGSVEVLDEFKINENASDSEDEDDEETIYKKRMVSYVELRIWLQRE
ncbi:Rpp20 subunit of nuclear RNase MRP and P-domain-containing protein [Scheffersomyces xylosifermentans]|uniref:Rpp20 subunit of nuclear RNase MRP and P-domain-containing protein n=1 Tax=Scheffersomyces xylosifermentans TaxID=1304137 RepID=UPI00315DE10F